MKIQVKDNLDLSKIIKRCGYAEIRDRKGQTSYVRRAHSYRYPRFHVYLEDNFINLHLDQKEPIYEGAAAHNGEYDGEVVEQEANKIKEMIEKYQE
jgi:hypothetical protein